MSLLAVWLSLSIITYGVIDSGTSASRTPHRKMRPYTISVEGNIGSGKSTLLGNYFDAIEGVDVYREPLDDWRNVSGVNVLRSFYDDPATWAFRFQTLVQTTLADLHGRTDGGRVKVMERTVHSATNCFVENLHDVGVLDPVEYSILRRSYEWLTRNVDLGVDLIIYMRTDPQTCSARINDRARTEEIDRVPIDYLRALHDKHEDWLIRNKFGIPAPALIVIDANRSIDRVRADVEARRSEILRGPVCASLVHV